MSAYDIETLSADYIKAVHKETGMIFSGSLEDFNVMSGEEIVAPSEGRQLSVSFIDSMAVQEKLGG